MITMSENVLQKANECTAKLNTASEAVTQVAWLKIRLSLMNMIMMSKRRSGHAKAPNIMIIFAPLSRL